MPRPGSMIVSGMLVGRSGAAARGRSPSVGLHRRHVLEVLGREAAAEIDHAQRQPALAAFAEHGRRRGERPVPGVRVALLGADMERDAIGFEAQAMGVLQHVAAMAGSQPNLRDSGHSARRNPRGCGRRRARRGRPGDLLHLGRAVDREQPHAERIGARDVTLLLMVLPKEMRAALAPAASTISISATRRCRSSTRARRGADSTSGAGFAFTA